MQIAIPLFDRFTALDAVGPFEVLPRVPDATVTFIATMPPGTTTTSGGQLLERHVGDEREYAFLRRHSTPGRRTRSADRRAADRYRCGAPSQP